MDCYECAHTEAKRAVMTCPTCGGGLCREHAPAAQTSTGPGGTSIGCLHGRPAGDNGGARLAPPLPIELRAA